MGEVIDLLSGLMIDASTPIQDKLSRRKTLHAKQNLEDLESLLENEMLEAQQKNLYNKLGMIVFGFIF